MGTPLASGGMQRGLLERKTPDAVAAVCFRAVQSLIRDTHENVGTALGAVRNGHPEARRDLQLAAIHQHAGFMQAMAHSLGLIGGLFQVAIG